MFDRNARSSSSIYSCTAIAHARDGEHAIGTSNASLMDAISKMTCLLLKNKDKYPTTPSTPS